MYSYTSVIGDTDYIVMKKIPYDIIKREHLKFVLKKTNLKYLKILYNFFGYFISHY